MFLLNALCYSDSKPLLEFFVCVSLQLLLSAEVENKIYCINCIIMMRMSSSTRFQFFNLAKFDYCNWGNLQWYVLFYSFYLCIFDIEK